MGDGYNNSPPRSIEYELLDLTSEMGKLYMMSPFEIFKQDVEEVIMLVNYVIEKGEESPAIVDTNSDKPTRIKVNDSTASGGWW